MGGATDRVYTINPKHMKVNRPQHLAEFEVPGSPHGPWSSISVIFINARIRIAEISRDTVDSMPLGSGDIDSLSYPQIAALDKKFEQLIADWPVQGCAPATVSSRSKPSTPLTNLTLPADTTARRLAVRQLVGLLSLHARRAKLLRPLLQIRDMPRKFEPFRAQCLRSAEDVMGLASSVLSEAVDTPDSQGVGGAWAFAKIMNRSAIVVLHVSLQLCSC